jgi:hypothetical protein
MRKRLTIELTDDDFRHILGALLKTKATFTVVDLDAEEPLPARTLKRRDDEGRTPAELVVAELCKRSGNTHLSQLTALSRTSGFNSETIRSATRRLAHDGTIIKDGDYYRAPNGTKS